MAEKTSLVRVPAISIGGGTGAGKSTACMQLAASGLVSGIVVFDTGSLDAYHATFKKNPKLKIDQSDMIKILNNHKPEDGFLIIDNWVGYEESFIANYKSGKPVNYKMSFNDWNIIAGHMKDVHSRLWNHSNVILVSNISTRDGFKSVMTEDGMQTVKVNQGELDCMPCLKKKQAYTSKAPISLALSSGSATFPRGWVTPYAGKLGDIGIKYQNSMGGFTFPLQEKNDMKIMPSELCTLEMIVRDLFDRYR